MAMRFIWDTRLQHRIRVTRTQGVEIVRGCLVVDIPVNESALTGTDSEVFIKALTDPQCPPMGSHYPTTVPAYASAILEEAAPVPTEGMGNNQCRIDFTYRISAAQQSADSGGGIEWIRTDSGQGSYVETYSTTFKTLGLFTWYRKGEAGNVLAPPAGDAARPTAIRPSRGVMRFKTTRTLRVAALLTAAQWLAVRDTINVIYGHLNSALWDGYPRGTWMFLYPVATSQDLGATYRVELLFLYDKNGHFPISVYFNEHGDRPADAASENDLDIAGPFPLIDDQITLNGISRHSVQNEVDFNSIFGFKPNS